MRLRSILLFDTKWDQNARLAILGYLLCSTHGLNNNSELMFVGAPHRHYKASRIAFRKYRNIIPRICVDKISREMKERDECKPHVVFVTFSFRGSSLVWRHKNDVTASEKSWNWVYEPETYQTNHVASLKFVSQTLLTLFMNILPLRFFMYWVY